MDYEAWFHNLLGQSMAWEASDFDRLGALEAEVAEVSLAETGRMISVLCERSGQHVAELGADAMGELIWYAMGSGTEWWRFYEDVAVETVESTILSLRALYEHCFAPHLTEWRGVGTASAKLETACYMLWDIDGGPDTVVIHAESDRLRAACYGVLSFALSLPSLACQESALHGLGHSIFTRAEPGRSIIDKWRSSAPDIPPELEQYANAAWSGCVQ